MTAAIDFAASGDLSLARRASMGDEKAFAEIYETNYKQVFYQMLRTFGDWAEAEDLTQEVFLRVHQFVGSYRGSAGLSRWIRRIAKNLCIDKMRRKAVVEVSWPCMTSSDGEGQEIEFSDEGPSPADIVVTCEAQDRILDAITNLPPYYRSVVQLYDVQDKSGEQVAEELACPLGTVKSRLSRGHALLRSSMSMDQTVIAATGS